MITSDVNCDGWRQWQCTAYRGKRGEITLGKTFVKADSESEAMELGKRALKLLGVRGRFFVSASKYYPWRDLAMLGYVSQSSDAARLAAVEKEQGK